MVRFLSVFVSGAAAASTLRGTEFRKRHGEEFIVHHKHHQHDHHEHEHRRKHDKKEKKHHDHKHHSSLEMEAAALHQDVSDLDAAQFYVHFSNITKTFFTARRQFLRLK